MCHIAELSLGRSRPSEHSLLDIRKGIMNRIYRSIWNEKAGTFVAASESANSNGNKSSSGTSALALNRVLAPDASSILGMLSANDKVFLLNPNGILI